MPADLSNNGIIKSRPALSRIEGLFRNENNQIMVAAYSIKGDSFVQGKPRIWSETRLADLALIRMYDLASDGKRIAALMSSEAQTPQTHITFLENFCDELRRRVPVGEK